jgi:hypothetical protein
MGKSRELFNTGIGNCLRDWKQHMGCAELSVFNEETNDQRYWVGLSWVLILLFFSFDVKFITI